MDLIYDTKLSPDSSVVIKPNLCAIKSSETGATTDVRVVEAIINYLKDELDISIISIVESDGTQVLADMAFRLLGYARLSKKLDVKLVNLTKAPSTNQIFPANLVLKKISIPKVMDKANCFISVIFGCHYEPRRSRGS